MQLTNKQLDRLAVRERCGLKAVPVRDCPTCVDAINGDLVLLSAGLHLDLYIVIDRKGRTRQRKVIFK